MATLLYPDVCESAPWSETEPAEIATPPLRRRTILVVDDDAGIRKMLRNYLQQRGFRVWTAGDGEEALDICCQRGDEVEAVLLDVQLPRLDGPATLDGIHAFDPLLPVCFMTGDLGNYSVDDLVSNGMRHLFWKPLRLGEVAAVMRRLAEERR